MPGHKTVEDLTEAEIRVLLSKKLRSTSRGRLERFRRTGRLVELVPEIYPLPLDNMITQVDNEGQVNPGARFRFSWKRHTELSLLITEVFVVVIFVYLGVNGFEVHHLLNRITQGSMKQPTLTPTPSISALSLPTGHVHTSSSTGSQPVDTRIPKHLRPLVQPRVTVSIPTPVPQHGTRIQIPAIEVDAPIVHGDDWEQLKKGVAHHIGSADPGQVGNIVLSGHNDIYGEVFRYLEDLKPGDKIVLYTSQRSFTYLITGWKLVDPTQVDVMAPTPDASITLISCHPYLVDNHRIIVKGNLIG